jgi:hypothetical protein
MLNERFRNLVETMQMMVQVEKTVGDFYKACSQSFPHSQGFWVHLAEEEYRHAEAIDRLAKAVAEWPGDFEPGKVSPIEALQACITRVTSSLAALKSGGLTEANALLQAHLIESTFAEHKYTETIKTANPKYLNELEKLTADEAGHKTSILRRMKAKRANAQRLAS